MCSYRLKTKKRKTCTVEYNNSRNEEMKKIFVIQGLHYSGFVFFLKGILIEHTISNES